MRGELAVVVGSWLAGEIVVRDELVVVGSWLAGEIVVGFEEEEDMLMTRKSLVRGGRGKRLVGQGILMK